MGSDDYAKLQQFYGFEHLTQYGYDGVDSGEAYFQLYAIELKAGPAIVQPRVFGLDGIAIDEVLLWLSWPGAEELPEAVYPGYKSRGVYCWSDTNGSCGWSYGAESHINPPNGGPYTVWCNAGEGKHGTVAGSDALDRIGWWDDHITPNPWFKIAVKDGAAPPPPTTAGDAFLVDVSPDGETILRHIKWVAGAPEPGGLGSLAFMQDGEILMHIPWIGGEG
jgi:hypothetical protein